MDTGSEITAKIRSAIKAKLIELGAYVDDELPDYIMVMIANKKTKDQMTNDLNLFLGKNSVIFTDWVHSVLDRLQAISQKVASGGAAVLPQEKPRKSAPNEQLDSHVTRKNENFSGKRSHSESKGANLPAMARVKIDNSKSAKRDEKKQRKIEMENRDDDGTLKNSRAPKAEEKGRKHKRISPPRNENFVDGGEALRTRVEYNEDSIDRGLSKGKAELEKKEKRRHKLDSSSLRREPDSLGSKERCLDTEEPSLRHFALSSRSSNQKVAAVQPYKRRTSPNVDQEISENYRKRRSVVGQIVHRKVEEEDYEISYKKDAFVVGSTVKVTERKSNVPNSMQPKPSIFLKALNEANASVSRLKSAMKQQEEKQLKRRIIEEAKMLEEREEIMSPMEESENEDAYVPDAINFVNKNSGDVNAAVSKQLLSQKTVEYTPTPIKPSLAKIQLSRKVEYNEKLEPVSETSTPLQDMEGVQNDETLDVDSKDGNNERTRFVVTLDGVDVNFVEKIEKLNQRGSRDDRSETIGKSTQKDARGAILRRMHKNRPADDRVEMHETTATQQKSIDKIDRSVTAQKMPSPNREKSVDVEELGTVHVGFDDDDDETTDLSSSVALQSTTNGIKEVKICLDTDDEEDGSATDNYKREGLKKQLSSTASLDSVDKILERCKFWPSCKLGSACSYQHPSVPCKAFPTCRFGDRCLYIHPKCRFDAFCTNKTCPFSHSKSATGTRQEFSAAPPVVVAASPICKFSDRCTNSACGFRHPKPCTFGSNCMRADCLFAHPALRRPLTHALVHPPAAVGQKFKWVAPAGRATAENALGT